VNGDRMVHPWDGDHARQTFDECAKLRLCEFASPIVFDRCIGGRSPEPSAIDRGDLLELQSLGTESDLASDARSVVLVRYRPGLGQMFGIDAHEVAEIELSHHEVGGYVVLVRED
jgi:hypothetical protein